MRTFFLDRSRLADRAGVGRTVHEVVTPDLCPATTAFLAFPAVYGKFPLKVAAFAVDVDIQAVETGASLGERLGKHRADRAEQPVHLGLGKRLRLRVPVQASAPQRLVRVDVSHAADQRLIQQRALDACVPGLQANGQMSGVESRLK